MFPSLKQTLIFVSFAIITRYFITMYHFLGYSKTLTYNDASCKLHSPTDLHGSEDMAIGKEGLLFMTSGDLHNVFEHGSNAAKPGGIWAFNINPYVDQRWVNSPQRLPLNGFDQELHGFHGHGFYISNQTDRLYVVNHAHTYSGIEIFRIEYNGIGRLPTLQYESTIGGDGLTFKRGTINDVIEGGEEINEIYVTTWLPNALPPNGKKSKQKTTSEIMGLLDNLSVQLFGIKKTEVLRCVRNSQKISWDCNAATAIKFVGANGITVSPDRSQIYVNDAPMRSLSIFSRNNKDGSLDFLQKIDTIDIIDNIEYLQDDTIIMGSIPKPYQYSIDREILGKTDVPVAGGAVVASKNKDTNEWSVKRLVTHDGKLLSQISCAAVWDKKIFMGSPFSLGFLECSLE